MLGLVFLVPIQLPTKPVDFDILKKEVKIGTAKVFMKLTQSGGKKIESKMFVTLNDKQIKMTNASEWDFEALPILKTAQVIDDQGVEITRTRIDFKDGNAKVTTYVGKDSTVANVAISEGDSINDFAEFWLLRDEPEPKQKYECFAFDLGAQKWMKTEVRYMGEQVKTFGKTKVRLHHIRRTTETRTDDIWNDGSGMLFCSESSNGMTFVRSNIEKSVD
jgi:hypothetical protein